MSRAPLETLILAMLLAAGIILQAVEAIYLPPMLIPGVKFGLANSITLIVMVLFSARDALTHVALRATTVSLVTGTFLSTTFIYSLSGGLASAIVMLWFYRIFFGPFSFAGVSLVGALTHNLTQLALATMILGHIGVVTLAPWLIFMAVIAGVPNGVLVNIVAPRLTAISRQLQR